MAIRVFQIAKDYQRTPDEILQILREGGVFLKSHTSELTDHARHVLRTKLHEYKLTVIDDEEGSSDSATSADDQKARSKAVRGKNKKTTKKSKKEAPMKTMGVRVIKRAQVKPQEEELADDKVESTAQDKKFADEKKVQKPRHPRLKRPRPRSSSIQNRISMKIQEKMKQSVQADEKPVSQSAKAAAASAAAQTSKPVTAKPRYDARKPDENRGRSSYQRSGQDRSQESRGYSQRDTNRQGTGQRLYSGNRPQTGGRPQSGGGRPQTGGRPSFKDKRSDAYKKRFEPRSTSMAHSFKMAKTGQKGPATPVATPAFSKAPTKPGTRFVPASKSSKKKKKRRKDQENTQSLRAMTPKVSKVELPDEELGIVMLPDGVTVKVLAEKVNRMAKDVIKRLFERGVFATINDVLDEELAIDIAKDFGYLAEIISVEEVLQMEDEELLDQVDHGGDKIDRAPIVTILGHVDHGKTSLLDYIRTTSVAEKEAGGITQHIGAYQVTCHDEPIVFLDTPGHAAFTKMRARGTSVTDIVILVVAADDGVMPQTIEAINHAKAAKVPIIVAVNKIDKPEAQPDRVKQMLTEHDLIVEEYGGDAPCVLVSAKTGEGITDLLEMILLVSEMQGYTAVPQKRGIGSVIEAKLERGRGSVATVLVQDGTVRVGDAFITGHTFGRIRALYSDTGKRIEEAGPSTPVEILGCQDVPQAGDSFMVVASEVKAREISSFRKERARDEHLKRQKNASLEQLFSSVQKDEVAELSVIIKGDVQGSVEGLAHALEGIKSEKVNLRIIHQAVGSITENDVLLAVASNAVIIGFRIRAERPAHTLAEREQIEIRYYSIIYEAIQDIEAAMLGLVPPEYKEVNIGRATVRQVFQIPKIGNIAGSHIDDGKVTKDSKARVIRSGKTIFDGEVDTLKRFKDDVNEVKAGYECGIGMLGFSDFIEGDVLEIYKMESVKPTKLT
ncbi:MAG: translation initiation factor IF-2 [Acidobacteria bacterium]|nr:MAG: translation initiation factor IF-2 [Acidobacteriota bacterium]